MSLFDCSAAVCLGDVIVMGTGSDGLGVALFLTLLFGLFLLLIFWLLNNIEEGEREGVSR